MSRSEDIEELFKEIDEILLDLEEVYQAAKKDINIRSLPRVKVKSVLEHLRSVLDYSALDIFELVYSKPAGRIYFPYAETKAEFEKSIQRNLPGLKLTHKNIYGVIESIQPHAKGSSLLYDLCKITNENKHFKLTEQKKSGRTEMRRIGPFAIPPAGDAAKNAQIVMVGCSFNGIPMGSAHKVEFNAGMSDDDILRQFHPSLAMSAIRTGGNIRFNFDTNGNDVLVFLKECRVVIRKYIDDLRAELP